MTLEQWREEFGVREHPGDRKPSGCVAVPDPTTSQTARRALFGLSDYVVRSYTGGAYWLVPIDRSDYLQAGARAMEGGQV